MKYKLKIINYRPYEYELLQKKLDQLGKSHYITDDLSFITIFKKVDHPVYYRIDFFNPIGKTKVEKNKSKNLFYDPYLDECYEPIYNKQGMYVFVGDHPMKELIKWNEKTDFINDKRKFKNLNALMISLFVTLFFIIASFYAMNIDTFLSYGITIAYGGFILACITAIYRTFCNFFYTNRFQKQLQNNKHKLSFFKLNRFRKIYKIAVLLCILLISGGMIEDTLNAKSFDPQQHSLLLLKDLGIETQTELSTQAHSSFTVPHSYSSLEVGEDNSLLYIKEYQLRSKKAADKLMQDFKSQPDLYLCTSVQNKNNILYGYQEAQFTTLIIQNNNKVIIIAFGFEPHEKQIEKTIQFYSYEKRL